MSISGPQGGIKKENIERMPPQDFRGLYSGPEVTLLTENAGRSARGFLLMLQPSFVVEVTSSYKLSIV